MVLEKMLTAQQQNSHEATKPFFKVVVFLSVNLQTCGSFADGNREKDGVAGVDEG